MHRQELPAARAAFLCPTNIQQTSTFIHLPALLTCFSKSGLGAVVRWRLPPTSPLPPLLRLYQLLTNCPAPGSPACIALKQVADWRLCSPPSIPTARLPALPSRFPAACMGSPLAVHLSRWLWLSCSPPMLSSLASPPPIALPLSLLAYAPARLLDCKSVRLTLRLTLLGLPWSAYPCVCSPKASQCLCVSACVSKHSSTCACNTHVHWHMFYVPHADAALEACCLSISITMSWLGLTLALLSWPHTRHSSFALPLLLPSTPLPIIN
jgi:hypothetical protein